MNIKRLLVVFFGFILIAALLWYRSDHKSHWLPSQEATDVNALQTPLPPSPQKTTPGSPPNTAKNSSEEAARSLVQQEAEREKKVWDALFLTPISFYGKVIDEKRAPIPDANVLISFVDSLGGGETNTKRTTTTDGDGRFYISGHGLAAVINVSKAAYYRLNESGGTFGYSKEGGKLDPHPDAGSPAIFVLKKMGQTVPLIALVKYIKIPKSGKPVVVNLATGRFGENEQGDLKVEAWTNDQGHDPNSNQPYDWRCRVSAPGGGLSQRVGEFDFEAPSDGYTSFDEINMPASIGVNWRSQASRQYFVKMSGNRYARVEFHMIAGDDHFFEIKSYLNPIPGEKNLESDPARTIVPKS